VQLTCLSSAFCVALTLAISPGYSLEATSPDDATSASSSDSGLPADGNETETDPLVSLSRTGKIRNFSKVELCTAAASVAAANRLPVSFFSRLIQQESGFKPHVVSPAGAQGIAQFMPRVAASYGLVNPFEPIAALVASGKLLANLVLQFGNLGLAAAAYNAGPRRVQAWMAKKGKLPAETRHYVHSVTGRPAEHWAQLAGKDSDVNPVLPATCSTAAQPDEPSKPAIEIARGDVSPNRQTPLLPRFNGRAHASDQSAHARVVRGSMPRPSQFAIGLPVSRFAAMAQPIIMREGPRAARHSRAEATRKPVRSFRPIEGTKTPSIMVEEKVADSRGGSVRRGPVKAAHQNPTPRKSSKLVRLAAAR
jgi:hypothetical protein